MDCWLRIDIEHLVSEPNLRYPVQLYQFNYKYYHVFLYLRTAFDHVNPKTPVGKMKVHELDFERTNRKQVVWIDRSIIFGLLMYVILTIDLHKSLSFELEMNEVDRTLISTNR